MKLNVHFLPLFGNPDQLSGATVVVVDVLRATTTMLWALRSGARAVIPCLEVDDALRVAAAMRGDAVLGGERGGKRIPGFDLGNSPAEYSPQAVAGKTVVMTTTNGTRAMQTCRAAERVLLGAFVNISSLVAALSRAEHVAFLCAGTNGHVTREDVLFAGAAVHELRGKGLVGVEANDETELAHAAWQSTVGGLSRPTRLVDAMKRSRGGRNLLGLGFDSDIALAAAVDSIPVVGELLLGEWRVVAVQIPATGA